jgi:hypothetical protein
MLDVEGVTAVLSSAATTPVEPLTDEELSARVTALESARPLLDAACAHAAAELDARNVPDEVHGQRTGAWIATETRTPHGNAKRRVHVARRLRDEFPELDAALSEGRVSWWHCDTFCRAANPRIAHAMALLLPELIRMAEWAPFGPWCRELRPTVGRRGGP